jgi:beta-xylosidase
MGGAAGVAGVAAAGGAPGQGGTSRSDAGGRGGAGPGGGSTTDGAAGETGASPSGDATDAGEAGDLSDGGETGAGVISSFQNGVFWTDVAGNRIEAHGAGFIKVGTTWYWVGEDRSQNSGAFRGMNLYASTDLSKWEFRHTLITRATVPDLNVAGRIIERPKLIHNDTTGQFVMWLHWDGNNYADAATAVFSSSTIDGDYVYHASFRPNANMSRDDTLFKDDDGSAYFISAANNNADLIIYQLTADYLDIARQVVTLWPGSFREAPAMFKANGRYFLISSGATGWDPNQARYASATSVAGPWSALQNLGDSTTYDTQSAYVISLEGRQGTTYIYAGDRWQDPDLVSSKYIWLPLTQNAATLRLDYHDQWRVNVTTGLVVP